MTQSETIIRTDTAYGFTVIEADTAARTAIVDFTLGAELILSDGTHITYDVAATRTLNWMGDDNGGGWDMAPIDDVDNQIVTVKDRSTGTHVSGDYWTRALVGAVTFGPALPFTAITQDIIRGIDETVDPILVFRGALSNSLPK